MERLHRGFAILVGVILVLGLLPATIGPMSDDRRGMVGEDRGHRGQVARPVHEFLISLHHVVKDVAHRVPAFGLGIEVADVDGPPLVRIIADF